MNRVANKYLGCRGEHCPESPEAVVEFLAALALRQNVLLLVAVAPAGGRRYCHFHLVAALPPLGKPDHVHPSHS